MAHLHSVYDTDKHFTIDPITRDITNKSSKVTLMQYDHNSERFTFEIPRMIEGHDMTLCNCVRIHFINIGNTKTNKSEGVYEVDDIQISPDSEDVIIFSWLIKRSATEYNGSLNFAVRFYCIAEDSTVDYSWGTNIFSGIKISNGLDNSDVIVDDYIDVLEKWKNEVLSSIPPETIRKIESLDLNNMLILRDLDSGTYVLYGEFKPYPEADSTISFSSDILVNIIRRTNDSQVQIFYPHNNCVQYLKITDTSYERTNVYLNDLATKVYVDQTIPTNVIQYSEQALTEEQKLQARQNIGAGKPQVQPDWNQNDSTAADYVKNRPFYTGDPVETVLVEESTVSFVDTGSGFYMAEFRSPIEVTIGETYKVTWDGIDYECACVDFSSYQVIGNLSIIGAGSDTGEPFFMQVVNGEGCQIAASDTSTSHTFSISGTVAQIVKIDDKYLAISETIDVSSLSEWTGEQKQNLYDKFMSGKILLAKNIPDVDGLLTITYVNYDNMHSDFEINAIGSNCACKSYGSSWDIFELSDNNVQNLINNTLRNTTSWNLYSASATNVDIGEVYSIRLQCIEGKPVFYFQLKGNPGTILRYKYPFLQKDTELEIGSSTASSSKVFKLTVDDSGIIKTTNTSDSTEIQFAKISDIPFKPDGKSYLTFSSFNNFTLGVNDTTKHWDGTLEYFTSDRTWTTWDGTNILSAVYDDGEYVLYLRGIGNTVITGNSHRYKWILTGTDIKCIGNIENLLDYATVESGSHPSMADYCYNYMFFDCTSLTQAPSLPATTLANECYSDMFYGCTSLIQAPALPATTLANYCYSGMFRHCTSLTQAPSLPATTLAESCYRTMFSDCTSLTQAPALPATTLAENCYHTMFSGCTSLTKAPVLPATTMANYCYFAMFRNCTSLTHVPALPATTLISQCYRDMFNGCTSLKLSSTQTDEYTQEYRIPSSGESTSLTDSLTDMFTSTGGTFTGTPEINTTYYLSSDNMIIRDTDISTLNGYVGSMIEGKALILPSSTTGSTKKFKITVDDSGTVSATEITT